MVGEADIGHARSSGPRGRHLKVEQRVESPAPATAGSSACAPELARSAVTTRAAPAAQDLRRELGGVAGHGVTSWPACRACRRTCRPTPPVAAMIVSFMMSSLFCVFFSEWRLGRAWYVSPTTSMSTQGEKCILPRRWPQAADTDRTTAAGGG